MTHDELIREALAREPGQQRTEFLDAACAGNGELRAAVEARLERESDARPTSQRFVESGRTLAQPADSYPATTGLNAGLVIAGRYTLVRPIGAGGMGEVWIAQQTEPVRRQVALKLIKAGMDSRAVVQRFEAERQALAVMDHPGIARVLDGGLTDDHRPFFVMELVDGVPLNKFCDEALLGIRERLQLFITICNAVQHAHQKGIVHRDLKPANILVAQVDGRAVPKIIDFGLAKATQGRLTDESLFTEIGAVLGTLEYMSPEQADGASADVDTRSDIYSLGVILYELLTGLRPIDARSFRRAALHEIVRTIREVEPVKPSSRISTEESLPSLASVRRVEPAQLTRLLRGDLDWVAMKCLEKQRERRYETANSLARDIERYLSDEPVEATPPSAAYRLQKFVRRNKGPVLAASLVTLALIAGIVGTTIGLVRARKAAEAERLAQMAAEQRRQEAEAQRVKAERAADNEQRARVQAQQRLAQIEKSNAILAAIFDDLDIRKVKQGNDPLEAVLAKHLVRAAKQLEGESVGDPLMVAAMQDKLGRTLGELGFFDDAISLLEKARQTREALQGIDHEETLGSIGVLADSYRVAGRLESAIPLLESGLKLTTAKFGPEHPNTLRCMNNLAEGYRATGQLAKAIQLLENTVKLQKVKLGADHLETLTSMNNLANGYRAAGKRDLAVALLEETLALTKAKVGADHADTHTVTNNLALSYLAAGKVDRAIPLWEQSLKSRKIKLGSDHPHTLTTMHNLALGYDAAGRLEAAIAIWDETLRLRKARLGADHPDTLLTQNNLASAYQDAGRLELAMSLLEESMQITKAKFGAEHPGTLLSMNNLAMGYLKSGKLDLAIPLFEETFRVRTCRLGPDHNDTLLSQNNLAGAYQAAGKLDLAVPLFEKALKLSESRLGPDHPDTLRTMSNLATAYRAAGKSDQALPLHAAAARGLEQRQFKHQYAGRIMSKTILGLEEACQFDSAEQWRRKWLAVVKENAGGQSKAYADELVGLGRNLLRQDKWPAAEASIRESLAILEKSQSDLWEKFNAMSMLGCALLGQKRYADAEPLLTKGFEGLRDRANSIPKQEKYVLSEALDSAIQLFVAWDAAEPGKGFDAKAAEWRKRLTESKP